MTQQPLEALTEGLVGIKSAEDLRARIETWRDGGGLHSIADFKAQVQKNRDLAQAMTEAARETTTHYVWPVQSNWTADVGVYVHEYKDPSDMRSGYADSVHDHRYSFASLILAGGYTETRYSLDFHGDRARITATEDYLRQEGDVVAVESDVFHRVHTVLPQTLTLVLKARPTKRSSTSVDLATGGTRTHTPTENRLSTMLELLDESAARAAQDA